MLASLVFLQNDTPTYETYGPRDLKFQISLRLCPFIWRKSLKIWQPSFLYYSLKLKIFFHLIIIISHFSLTEKFKIAVEGATPTHRIIRWGTSSFLPVTHFEILLYHQCPPPPPPPNQVYSQLSFRVLVSRRQSSGEFWNIKIDKGQIRPAIPPVELDQRNLN